MFPRLSHRTMAVSSLHYTMGISSGFKVYILEGHRTSRDHHGIPIYPIKRKLSPGSPQLPKRSCPVSPHCREKVPSSLKNVKSAARHHPPPASTPQALSPHVTLEHVLKKLMPERKHMERKEVRPNLEDQPLALVKRVQKESSGQPTVPPPVLQQMRPSVITCVSRASPTRAPPTETVCPLRDGLSQGSSRSRSSDIVVEEHFQRSFGSGYTHPSIHHPSLDTSPSPPTSSSVQDHFSKALGSKWLLIRAAADSPSSPGNRTRNVFI